MNALINMNRQPEYQVEEKEELDNGTIGFIVAFSLIGSYTLFGLVISSWSAVLLLTGSSPSYTPIGLIVDLINTSGILWWN